MKDCMLTLSAKAGKVRMEAEQISVEELAEMSGVLQIITGKAALAAGSDIETVKDKMLDIHLAAMRQVELYREEDTE